MLEFMTVAFSTHGATNIFMTDGPNGGETFIAARRLAIPAVEHLDRILLEDVGVPLSVLPDLMEGIDDIATNTGVPIAVIAHAGDGNTHPLIIHDDADSTEVARATIAFGETMDLAPWLVGAVTGERGVGRLKKAWLPDQLGEDAMELTRTIKTVLDPQHIRSPGAML